jgi:hypothetical protein
LSLLAIGSQHGAEGIGGGKRDLRHGDIRRHGFQRQRVLEFVSQVAEFTAAGGGGIAFYSVDDSADAADGFKIAGSFFQLQRVLVERLQQLLRAFEEQLPQFGAAFIRELGHSAPSISWYAVPVLR